MFNSFILKLAQDLNFIPKTWNAIQANKNLKLDAGPVGTATSGFNTKAGPVGTGQGAYNSKGQVNINTGTSFGSYRGIDLDRSLYTIRNLESANKHTAINKHSGAMGYYQFLRSTATGMGYKDHKAFLNNPNMQHEAAGKLAKQNIDYFYNKMGRAPKPEDLYGMWGSGAAGYINELRTGTTNKIKPYGYPSTDVMLSKFRAKYNG